MYIYNIYYIYIVIYIIHLHRNQYVNIFLLSVHGISPISSQVSSGSVWHERLDECKQETQTLKGNDLSRPCILGDLYKD